MHIFNLIMLSAALGVACGEPDSGADSGATADGGSGDAGTADGGGGGVGDGGDTGGSGISFTEVATGHVATRPACGVSDLNSPIMCDESSLVVLSTDSMPEFEALFMDLFGKSVPDVDLKDRVALISYLPVCPSLHDWIEVDRVDLDGSVLRVDETRISSGGGQAEACLYNVEPPVKSPSTPASSAAG